MSISQRVIYPLSNGGVAIVIPSPETKSLQQLIDTVPAGRSYQVVDQSEIPSDRTFRDAWTYSED
jgi:hypothetical protein|tara:strand:- start:156 stop:350 length:195 start_codon:yes stop_codon:yes gene_type:complete